MKMNSVMPSPRERTAPLRARHLRRRRSQRGVALILVLGSLAIMAVMLTEFQDESSAEFGSALSYRDSLKAEYAARSGITLTRLLLAAEPQIRKDLTLLLGPLFLGSVPQIPVWEYAEDVLGAFNDIEGGARFAALTGVGLEQGKNLGLEGSGFEIQVTDEDSKLNLNKGAKGDAISIQNFAIDFLGLTGGQQYAPLFENRDADGQFSDRQTICNAIVDWVDPDQTASSCDPFSGTKQADGPEDSFYQLLKDPYPRKNAGFDSLQELRLVRGVGDDFWATFVEPDPLDQKSRVVTVWGRGQVNVNTANAQTLASLACAHAVEGTQVCEDPAIYAQFVAAVSLLRTMTAGIPLFGTPNMFLAALEGKGMLGPMLTGIGIPPITFRSNSELVKGATVQSKVFSIVATGYVKAHKRQTRVRVHAVVDFNKAPAPWDVRRIYEQQQTLESFNGQNFLPVAEAAPDADGNIAPDAIATALTASPDGQILYFRVE